MKFYYCTGIDHFKQVMQEGVLLSDYERVRRTDERAAGWAYHCLPKRGRLSFLDLVLLTDKNSRFGHKGTDLRLEFELDAEPLGPGPGYIKEREIKLANLVSIGYTEKVEKDLQDSLRGTPYQSVPIHQFQVPKNTFKRERKPRPRRLKEHRGH
jgi:hypothetical protein